MLVPLRNHVKLEIGNTPEVDRPYTKEPLHWDPPGGFPYHFNRDGLHSRTGVQVGLFTLDVPSERATFRVLTR